jgi:2',3'-cyclic-nucleotide 2'-phosphodiesterase/3'-nucleotidase
MRASASAEKSLILDNGDMWTGPVESTVLRGEPVVAAYNALGIAAANVANHEFDFGMKVLRSRASEADFPFLGANVSDAASGAQPDFLRPWIVEERNGVKVGVIGLSFRGTPKTTLKKHVEGLTFGDYAETLRREVPKMKAAGAEVIAVLLHDVPAVGHALVREVGAALGIHLVVAGQDHRKSEEVIDGVPVVNPGPFGASYARFDVTVDPESRAVRAVEPTIVDVAGRLEAPPHPPVAELAAIAEGARARTQALVSEELGRLAKPLPVGSFSRSPLGHFIVDSWLDALGDAIDFAVLNHGAIRQPLPAGAVSLADITSVMPFENNIYIVELTGAELFEQLAIDHPVVAGFTWSYRDGEGGREVASVVDDGGAPLDEEAVYRVAILDFMYTGGDGYTFAAVDGSPVDTGLSWRDPVVRALTAATERMRAIDPNPGARARELP